MLTESIVFSSPWVGPAVSLVVSESAVKPGMLLAPSDAGLEDAALALQ